MNEVENKVQKVVNSIPNIIINGSLERFKNKKYKIARNIIDRCFICASPKIINKTDQNMIFNGVNIDNDLHKKINAFVNVLEEKLSQANLNNLYNNLITLKIKDENYLHYLENIFLLKMKNIINPGNYYGNSNTISMININLYSSMVRKMIDDEKMTYALNHELLHMSSSVSGIKNKIINKGIYYSGFCQSLVRNIEIGRGINEGYTELLNCRYFNEGYIKSGYEYEFLVAKLVEELIGTDNMTNLYFNADLSGLIKQISVYSSDEDTKKFILDLDLINKSLSDKSISYEIINDANDRIINFISNVSLNKIIKDLDNGIISEKDFYIKTKQLVIDLENVSLKVNNRGKKKNNTDLIYLKKK